MESAKAEYESSLVAIFGSSPRTLYSFLRGLGKTNSMPNSFHQNNSVIDNPQQIAELFNNYFNTTFTSSEFMLPDIDQLSSPSTHLSNIFISESDVYEVLTTLNPTKSAGSDEVSAKLLKSCATSLVEPVTYICHLSLKINTFPADWKVHKICPIPKKGDLCLVKNYRPISLLPILSKVLESIVYKKIVDFIRPQLNKHQFGFLKNRSCLSEMLSFSLTYSRKLRRRNPRI